MIEANKQGWVLLALHLTLYHWLHTDDFETALTETIALGADSDTTAAIVGALLGAQQGEARLPTSWVQAVASCRPNDLARTHYPRPERYWPAHALEHLLANFQPNV